MLSAVGSRFNPTVFTPVLKNRHQRGKIAPGNFFKFILSAHFSEKKIWACTTYSWHRVSFQGWEVGGWCNHVILEFVYFTNIWSDMYSTKFVCKLELSFCNIFSKKKTWKLDVLIIFLCKNKFLPIFHTQNEISQFSRVCSHYDIMGTSYINGEYLFWYQWKEDIHRLVVNLGLYDHPYW